MYPAFMFEAYVSYQIVHSDVIQSIILIKFVNFRRVLIYIRLVCIFRK